MSRSILQRDMYFCCDTVKGGKGTGRLAAQECSVVCSCAIDIKVASRLPPPSACYSIQYAQCGLNHTW